MSHPSMNTSSIFPAMTSKPLCNSINVFAVNSTSPLDIIPEEVMLSNTENKPAAIGLSSISSENGHSSSQLVLMTEIGLDML